MSADQRRMADVPKESAEKMQKYNRLIIPYIASEGDPVRRAQMCLSEEDLYVLKTLTHYPKNSRHSETMRLRTVHHNASAMIRSLKDQMEASYDEVKKYGSFVHETWREVKAVEAEEKEIERQFEQQLLRVRDRKEQILARHHSTNTDFKIRSAIHEDEQEKLKAQEELCAKCQEQSGKV